MCRAMNKAKQLIDRLEAQHSLSIEEYEYLIENQSDELAAYAAEKAVALRKQVYGTDVYIRGLIEIGNICRNDCYYCWLAADSTISPITSNATLSVFGSLYHRLPISKPSLRTLATSNRQQFMVSRRADISWT